MLLDTDRLAALASVDSSIAEALGPGPIPRAEMADDLEAKRLVASNEANKLASMGPVEDTLEEYTENFVLKDGTKSSMVVCRPAAYVSEGQRRPLIVLFFGGGFISGSAKQMLQYARCLARAFRAVVVCPEYRLAPQHPFPTQAKDCFEALVWTAQHATRLGADPSSGFVVGGPSAGANCTAAVIRMSLEQTLPHSHVITGQWLAIPIIFTPNIVPERFRRYYVSREQNANSPIIDKAGVEAIERHVRWDSSVSSLPWPTLSTEPLSKVPPTFFQACGTDPFRDDALIYEEMLKESGVATRINVYPGCPHGFWNVWEDIEVSKKAWIDILTGFAWLLKVAITSKVAIDAIQGPKH